MKMLLKVIAVIAAVLVIVLGGTALLTQAGVETPLTAAGDKAANAALEASGIKEKADAALRSNAARIAEKTGMPLSAVEGAIDALDIPSWQVTALPADAEEAGTASIEYDGMAATLTTYDDPSVVTVDTGMGAVTLEVPPSAQGYMGYMGYL